MAGQSHEAVELLPTEQKEARRSSDEESTSSGSTTSLVFERIGERALAEERNTMNGNSKMVTPKYPPRGDSLPYADDEHADISLEDEEKEYDDLENGHLLNNNGIPTG